MAFRQKAKNYHGLMHLCFIKNLNHSSKTFCFSGGIEGSLWAHDRFIDDVMIRKFIEGTFYELLVSDIIIKRTLNQITISIFVNAKGTIVHKVYFLQAFSETLLSHMFACVVKMEIMSVPL